MLTGDRLSFIAPFESNIPNYSAGGYLGLFRNESALNDTQNQIVAVEFDTYRNLDFSDQSDNHVRIWKFRFVLKYKNLFRSPIKNYC